MRDGWIADDSTIGVKKRNSSEPVTRLVPALTIVSHPQLQRVGDRLLLEAVAAGREVEVNRNEPDFLRPGAVLGAPLADPFVSRRPLVFAPSPGGGIRLTPREGSRVALAGVPLEEPWEFSPEELAVGVPLEVAERVVLLLHWASASASEDALDALSMVGTSVGLSQVRRHIEQVADLDVPVLIRGETGSGKELIARAIHQCGPRRDKAFVSVNLGAIPKELAAAELFGASKGSFTGAVKDREGFFRAADGGTLFLDEVGEAPPEVQVLLLRVLETREIYPVGERSPVSVDVRLLAATDAHLEQQIQEGRFKAPLLHRLAGYEISVPPLRERREDIGVLFHHFAREQLESLGEAWRLKPDNPATEPWLPTALASRLVRFNWPGNIRQLRNLTRQLIIGSRGQSRLRLDPRQEKELATAMVPRPGRSVAMPPVKAILEQELGLAPKPAPSAVPRHVEPEQQLTPRPKPSPEAKAASRRKASEVSEAELRDALRESDYDLKATADRLSIPRSSIYDLIARMPSIRTAGDLSVEEITRCHQECAGDLDAMARRLEVSRRALGRRIKELGLESEGT